MILIFLIEQCLIHYEDIESTTKYFMFNKKKSNKVNQCCRFLTGIHLSTIKYNKIINITIKLNYH